jgi:large conductance mechanosensitive channel
MLTLSSFLNNVFNFFAVGITLYFVAQLYTVVSKDEVIKRQIKCKYCRKYISEKVSRA